MRKFVAILRLPNLQQDRDMIDSTHVSQMTRARTIITPHLLANIPLTPFTNRKSFLLLSALHDQDALLVVHILVYSPEGRAFLEW